MRLEQGKTYRLLIRILDDSTNGGRPLSFTATIIEDGEQFLQFKDKFNKIITYNKQEISIISIEEVNQNGN